MVASERAQQEEAGGEAMTGDPTETSKWFQVSIAASWGAAVMLCSLGAQWLAYDKLLHDGGIRVIGSILAGLVTAMLAFRLETETADRRRADLRRFQVISEMNHHIRNALQVISYHAYVADPKSHGEIREAMGRIDWVLREVLPQVDSSPDPDQGFQGK
jgi:hypothetical protein